MHNRMNAAQSRRDYRRSGRGLRAVRPATKQSVAACASPAMSIKSVLDTPILDESDALTDESGTLMRGFDGNPE